jgi:hypothetical protein
MAWSSLPFVVLFALAVSAQLGASDLAPDYYRDTCPNLETIVRGVVKQKMDANIRAIGSTIRLFFHDCFVEVTHTRRRAQQQAQLLRCRSSITCNRWVAAVSCRVATDRC